MDLISTLWPIPVESLTNAVKYKVKHLFCCAAYVYLNLSLFSWPVLTCPEIFSITLWKSLPVRTLTWSPHLCWGPVTGVLLQEFR